MKQLTALFMFVLLSAYVQAAPVTTAVVNRPTTMATVSRPTTTATVNRPTTTAVVNRPTTVVPVLRPVTTAVVERPVTTATVSHPTTQAVVSHPGERGVSYVPTPAPAPAAPAAKAQSSASKPTSSSSVGSYTPSYKNAKDLKATGVPQAADMLKAASGLGMTNSDSAQKEADAKAFKVEKGMSTQVSEEDVLKKTKLPGNIDSILKQRNFEEAKAAGKK